MEGRAFRIGTLRDASDGTPGPEALRALASNILNDPALLSEFVAAGYGVPIVVPCDGGEDLLRRLDAGELDLAFAPAKTMAQQRGAYDVLLQSRRPGDSAPPREGPVLTRGVLVVSPRHPAFATGGDLRASLTGRPLAVVSSQSLSGFVMPLLALERDHSLAPAAMSFLWFDSSEEVVKAVLSGLADAGACDAGAVDRVIAEAGLQQQRGAYLRVLLETPPVPTDPVLIRRELAAERSALGRRLRETIRTAAERGTLGPIQFQQATAGDYSRLPGLLQEFDRRVGVVRP